MKINLKNSVLAVALISLPVTVFAAYYDAYFETSTSGQIGSPNTFYSNAYGSLAVGYNNLLGASNTAGIGTNLQVYDSNSVVVGQYNLPVSGAELFVVGNGSSSNDRKNALEVMVDGTVTIKKVPAAGGISMGGFTTP